MEINDTTNSEAAQASIDLVSLVAEETLTNNNSSNKGKAKASRKGKLIEPRLDEIVVEGRFRTHAGDVAGLAKSMEEVGLLEPPILDAQMRLVCGHRRLLAARHLGWAKIPAIVLDIEDPLLATIAEDKERKPLLASEKYAVTEALRERAKDPAWRRRAVGGAFHAAERKGRLDEAIAKHVGLSRESLRKIRQLHDRAREDETRFGDLSRALDEDGRVDRHYRELQRRLSRGDDEAVSAFLITPGWVSLLDDGVDLAKFAKERGLAARGEDGCLLVMPSPIRLASDAAVFVGASGFRWATTLDGAGGDEAVWLVGVIGRRHEVPSQVVQALSTSVQWSSAALAQALGAATGQEPTVVSLAAEDRS